MNHTTIIIFGATGDLARRKLIPALCTLIQHNHLSSFLIIGAGREEMTKAQIFEQSSAFMKLVPEASKTRFLNAFFYRTLDVYNQQAFSEFAHFVSSTEKSHDITRGDRVIYCATASDLFIPITQRIAQTNIIRSAYQHVDSNDKIIYEKPFGKSKDDACKINACIKTHFGEKQIFRVDHYLSKELVRILLNIRFSNSIFETQLNNHHVDQVQIIARESIGIEGRAAYYDAYGAVKDMVQNHLLSLLALLVLEKPNILESNAIAIYRRNVLKDIVFQDGILGQCTQYKQEPGISPESNRETFAALVFFVQNDRWSNVPFYIETGKYLAQKETIIRIKFKSNDGQQTANWLTIQIAPEARFSLSLHIKSPKSRDELVTVPMEFCHSCIFGSETPAAYETLLYEVLIGDRWSVMDPEEIECAWEITELIQQRILPLLAYEKGIDGPERKMLCDHFGIDLA